MHPRSSRSIILAAPLITIVPPKRNLDRVRTRFDKKCTWIRSHPDRILGSQWNYLYIFVENIYFSYEISLSSYKRNNILTRYKYSNISRFTTRFFHSLKLVTSLSYPFERTAELTHVERESRVDLGGKFHRFFRRRSFPLFFRSAV